MLGDIFVCSSCERELFEQNVTKIDGLEEKVEKKKPGLFRKCIPRKDLCPLWAENALKGKTPPTMPHMGAQA